MTKTDLAGYGFTYYSIVYHVVFAVVAKDASALTA